MPFLARHREHVAQRREVAIDGRGAAWVPMRLFAFLDGRAYGCGICAREGLASELAAVLDQDGRGHVGELQVSELLFPPGEVRAMRTAVALLGQLLREVAVDRLAERTASGLHAAEVPTLDHVGFDGRRPALGEGGRGKARGARREAVHADLDVKLPGTFSDRWHWLALRGA